MDPLQLTPSITTVIQVADRTVAFLRDVKKGPDGLKRLSDEIRFTRSLLEALDNLGSFEYLENPWTSNLKFLTNDGTNDGPLVNFHLVLTRLEEIARPRRLSNSGIYALNKREILELQLEVERYKSLFKTALQVENLHLSRAIREYVKETREHAEKTKQHIEEEKQRALLLHHTVATVFDKQERRNLEQGFNTLLEWISPLNFSLIQNDFFGLCQEGTGEWFLKNDKFTSWRDGIGQILWCPGSPGAGKTILTSIVVNHLETGSKTKEAATIYAYFNHKKWETQTDVNVMSNLVQQLVAISGSAGEDLWTQYNQDRKKKTRPSFEEWATLLKEEAKRHWRIYLVLDALDEAEEKTREAILNEVRGLPNTCLLMTMRRSVLPKGIKAEQILEIQAREDDLRKYILSRIPTEPRLLRHVDHDKDLEELIVSKVIDRARGMFLVARLHMDSLAKKHTRRDLRSALKHLPQELDVIYTEAMARIEHGEYDAHMAKRILSWIVFAAKSLTVPELQHALAVSPDFDDTNFDEEAVPSQDILTSLCAGLVSIDSKGNTVRLVHYTCQEYFDKFQTKVFPQGPMNVAKTCLSYLDFDVFSSGACGNDQALEDRNRVFSLLEYAAQHWGKHAAGEPERELLDHCLPFFKHKKKLEAASQMMLLPNHRYPGYSQHYPRNVTGPHVTAWFGLPYLTQALLDEPGFSAVETDSNNQTPLHWAARRCNVEVVSLLAGRREIDINAKDIHGRTPLSYAAENGCDSLIQVFLNHRVDIDATDNTKRGPLSWAAAKGHAKVVDLLLKSGLKLDINAKDSTYGRSPIGWAARPGHSEVVRLLLGRPEIDANIRDSYAGQTPLMWACEWGHPEVVRLLLQSRRFNIDEGDDFGQSSLICATRNGDDNIVRMLMEHKFGSSLRERSTSQALLRWAEDQSIETVEREFLKRLFRDRIDDENAEEAGDLLLWASRHGHEGLAKALLRWPKVPLDPTDALYRRTPLTWAACNNHKGITKILLDKNVKVNAKDSTGRSPLSLAAQCGNDEIVQLLLERSDVDVESRDSLGRPPLSFAAGNNHLPIVKQLIEHPDVNPGCTDSYGDNALIWASERGYTKIAETLLECEEIKAFHCNVYNHTALMYAAGNGHPDIVEMLLRKDDVDLSIRDTQNRTALMWAKGTGEEACVQQITHYLKSRGVTEEEFATYLEGENEAEEGEKPYTETVLGLFRATTI